MWYRNRNAGEIFLLLSGVTLLLSLPVLAATGSFLIWVIGKAFYAAGVALYLIRK